MSAPIQDQIEAHQYLYYVLCQPIITDYEYDQLCASAGIPGGGGSDLASSYRPEVVELAMRMRRESP